MVGNIGIDTNVYFSGDGIDLSVEANFTTNIDSIGQAGGYAARGYAALGYKTAFIGYIGADYSGDFIRSTLVKEKIDTSAVFIDPEGTSRSINLDLSKRAAQELLRWQKPHDPSSPFGAV